MTLNAQKLKLLWARISHAEAVCAKLKAMSKLIAIDLHGQTVWNIVMSLWETHTSPRNYRNFVVAETHWKRIEILTMVLQCTWAQKRQGKAWNCLHVSIQAVPHGLQENVGRKAWMDVIFIHCGNDQSCNRVSEIMANFITSIASASQDR
jgi:hypothetical protein